MKNLGPGNYIYALISGLIWIYLFVRLIKKRRHSRNKWPLEAERIVEDPQRLLQAEHDAKHLDLRQELSKNYEFLDSYSTTQGYSEDYINQLVNLLEQHQINSNFIFIESMPAGSITFLERSGTFELYVQKDKIEKSMALVEKFRASNSN